jgi:hypothetical protein
MLESVLLKNLKTQLFQLLGTAVRITSLAAVILSFATTTRGTESVMLTGVPDYAWYGGCFGTATGNLMGYWDRHGFPNLYTGPTGGGVAPLSNAGVNFGIRSMWASKAGLDGRPTDQFGHIDDYWVRYNNDTDLSYESAAPDPYLTEGRPEHEPDCISDFIGASQNKWKSLDNECDGNIDAFAYNFWDAEGNRRINYVPPSQGDIPVRDIQSGLKAWTKHRGYEANLFSQLVDFNPNVTAGHGFTFEDLKAEIDAGYPVMLFLQNFDEKSRSVPGMLQANPICHGMLAYGYYVTDSGTGYVRYKNSWSGSGDFTMRPWTSAKWEALLPLRGVIGFHPLPQIKEITRDQNKLTIKWDGPSSTLNNLITGTSTSLHWYVVEQSPVLSANGFVPVTEPTKDLEATITNCCENAAFFRVRLVQQ